VLDRNDATGHLLRQFVEATAFLKRNLRTGYRIETLGPREEVPEIPGAVLREALLNALTHRDYFADAEHIYVHVHPGRVEITNPGGLPPGLTIADLGTRAVPRNRLIADLFHRMGYVERLGSGIARMRQVMAEAGLPPPRFTVSADAFRIALETWSALGLGPETAPVLDAVRRRGHVTAAMVADQLKVSRDTAQRLLNKLVEAGLIERVGAARSTRYVLKDAQP
jgi:ATP-dependent DNA helicase RecG